MVQRFWGIKEISAEPSEVERLTTIVEALTDAGFSQADDGEHPILKLCQHLSGQPKHLVLECWKVEDQGRRKIIVGPWNSMPISFDDPSFSHLPSAWISLVSALDAVFKQLDPPLESNEILNRIDYSLKQLVQGGGQLYDSGPLIFTVNDEFKVEADPPWFHPKFRLENCRREPTSPHRPIFSDVCEVLADVDAYFFSTNWVRLPVRDPYQILNCLGFTGLFIYIANVSTLVKVLNTMASTGRGHLHEQDLEMLQGAAETLTRLGDPNRHDPDLAGAYFRVLPGYPRCKQRGQVRGGFRPRQV